MISMGYDGDEKGDDEKSQEVKTNPPPPVHLWAPGVQRVQGEGGQLPVLQGGAGGQEHRHRAPHSQHGVGA